MEFLRVQGSAALPTAVTCASSDVRTLRFQVFHFRNEFLYRKDKKFLSIELPSPDLSQIEISEVRFKFYCFAHGK